MSDFGVDCGAGGNVAALANLNTHRIALLVILKWYTKLRFIRMFFFKLAFSI